MISGDTLPVKKPDPAMLRHACDRLGVGVTDSLMIGDSENDALAACLRHAGAAHDLRLQRRQAGGTASNAMGWYHRSPRLYRVRLQAHRPVKIKQNSYRDS